MRSLVAALLLTPALLTAQSLEFLDHGAPVKELDLAALRKVVAPVEIGMPPRWEDEAPRRYQALPFVPLLDAVYGETWREAELVMVRCADGFQPLLAVTDLRERDATTPGALAFQRKGEDGLWEEDEDGDEVDFGPFRLFWPGSRGPKSAQVLATPYKVVGFDLVEFADRFPRLAPPEDAGEAAARGFVRFRQNCIQCHTVNGDGSATSLGPELNYPSSVTEYWKPDWLRRFLLDPRSIRYKSKMPGLARLPKTSRLAPAAREAVADDLIAYLEAMRDKKVKPGPPPQGR
jgi:mono/diheme cytochrome c family protein